MTAHNAQMPALPSRRPGNRRQLTVGVVIQARQSSSRFPGKSMATLLGKPVLQHVIERCKLIRSPFGIRKPMVIITVPHDSASEPMGELADKLKIQSFAGSEHNVLERYYHTAKYFNLNFIVRITADCPFIDPVVCTHVLSLLIWRKCDYVSNCSPDTERTYPKGLDCEAFTMDCLEAAHVITEQEIDKYNKLIPLDKEGNFKVLLDKLEYSREHVTPWMVEEPQLVRALVKQKEDKSSMNWCVDYPEDIARLEKEYEEVIKNYKKKASNDNESKNE